MKRCPHCTAENANEHEVCYNCKKSLDPTSVPSIPTVRITDIDMPLGSMTAFMVKWAIASIPVFLILFVLAMLIVTVFGGLAGLGSL